MIPTVSELIGKIRPSNCGLKYHFGPKMLEYCREKLFKSRFLQLVFVITLSHEEIVLPK